MEKSPEHESELNDNGLVVQGKIPRGKFQKLRKLYKKKETLAITERIFIISFTY